MFYETPPSVSPTRFYDPLIGRLHLRLESSKTLWAAILRKGQPGARTLGRGSMRGLSATGYRGHGNTQLLASPSEFLHIFKVFFRPVSHVAGSLKIPTHNHRNDKRKNVKASAQTITAGYTSLLQCRNVAYKPYKPSWLFLLYFFIFFPSVPIFSTLPHPCFSSLFRSLLFARFQSWFSEMLAPIIQCRLPQFS